MIKCSICFSQPGKNPGRDERQKSSPHAGALRGGGSNQVEKVIFHSYVSLPEGIQINPMFKCINFSNVVNVYQLMYVVHNSTCSVSVWINHS